MRKETFWLGVAIIIVGIVIISYILFSGALR